MDSFLIGLDFGSESARGVLVDIRDGRVVSSFVSPYAHGILTQALPNGLGLKRGWALQVASDYVMAAEQILTKLGRGRHVAGIGIGFTASSPLPTLADGTPLSLRHPADPHAYVKLWKHASAQPWADRINAAGGEFLANFGGRISGEWMLAKAGQIAAEAPGLWRETEKFIEAGDWMVWQLTGQEARGLGFAAFKAQYSEGQGYPKGAVDGLEGRLSDPLPVGSPAGSLSPSWRSKTGIEGPAVVAVAVIDSHLILPAIGATRPGVLAAALGTSAVYLCLSDVFRPLPKGIEGMALDGSVRDLWCYEAGQAGFGDTLAWFVNIAPKSPDLSENFRLYNAEAARLKPAESGLVALDWWNGNRVPFSDSGLTGMLLGLTRQTTAAQIYLCLMESVCFGARTIVDRFAGGDFTLDRIILSSGLAKNNSLIIQIMADVLNRAVEVPEIEHPTAVGAAIHGAVASGVVPDYHEGAARFGARSFTTTCPRSDVSKRYQLLYQAYSTLASTGPIREVMHCLNASDALH